MLEIRVIFSTDHGVGDGLSPIITDVARVDADRVLDGASFGPALRGGTQPWQDATLIQTGSGEETGPHPGWVEASPGCLDDGATAEQFDGDPADLLLCHQHLTRVRTLRGDRTQTPVHVPVRVKSCRLRHSPVWPSILSRTMSAWPL